MTEPKPVVCGRCKGAGYIFTKTNIGECPVCLGKGTV